MLVGITIMVKYNNNKDEYIALVNSYMEGSNLNSDKEILIKIENLNTDNFDIYFNNMKVLLVYSYINPVYQDKINIVYAYKSIEDFKNYYVVKLKENGYYMESNKYLYTPIKIVGVVVYSNIEDIKKKYNKMTVDSCENSLFSCVKIK
jgi:hypothetical protein